MDRGPYGRKESDMIELAHTCLLTPFLKLSLLFTLLSHLLQHLHPKNLSNSSNGTVSPKEQTLNVLEIN